MKLIKISCHNDINKVRITVNNCTRLKSLFLLVLSMFQFCGFIRHMYTKTGILFLFASIE